MFNLGELLGDGAAADPTDGNTGNVDTASLQAAIADTLSHSDAADAVAYATDLYNQLDTYVQKFTAAGRTDQIAQSAVNYENQLVDVLNNNLDDSGNITGSAAAISSAATSVNGFLRQLPSMLAASGGGTGTTTPPPTAAGAPPTISSVSDVSNPAGNAPPQPSPYGGMMAGGANPGDQVVITGTNLTGASSVTFGGVPAQFQVVSATQINATVPQGAPTGQVQVTTPAGAATAPGTFYVNSAGTAPAYGGDSGGGGGGSFGGGGGGGGGLDDSQVDWGDGTGPDDGGPDAGLDDNGIDWGDGAIAMPSDGGSSGGDGGGDDGGLLDDDSNIDWGDGSSGDPMSSNPYVLGTYAIGSTTIPAAVSYTDHDTVLAVQTALKAHGYDPGPLDGIFGKKTSAAIKKMQAAINASQSGIVDYGVLEALGVHAPASTPTTTTAGRSASAAAKDAEAVAASATTPAEVQAASQQVEAANAVAAPPPPPDVQEKVARASAAARAATTPAEVQAAAVQVKDAAKAVQSSTSWLGAPLWAGAPIRRWQGLAGVGAFAAVVTALGLIWRKR